MSNVMNAPSGPRAKPPSRSAHAPRDPMLRLFMHLGFKAKAALASALLVIPLLALLAWQSWSQYQHDMRSRQINVQQQVQVAHKLVVWAHGLEQSGALSRADAQRLASDAMAKLRYGAGDYFWINDMKPVMVMHPLKPEMNGQDLSGFKDPNGAAVFKLFVEAVRAKGEGLVAYQWPKPGSD